MFLRTNSQTLTRAVLSTFVLSLVFSSFPVYAPIAHAASRPDFAKGEVIFKMRSQSQARSTNGIAASRAALPSAVSNTRSLVPAKAKGSVEARGIAATRAPQSKMDELRETLMIADVRGDIEQIVRELESHPDVEYAEPNFQYSLESTNDPDFSLLYGLDNTGQTGGTPDADIDAPEAWAAFTSTSSLVVAVQDTGIDYTHPDLIDNMWKNPGETGPDGIGGDKETNGIDDDGNGFIDDVHGWDFINNDNDPFDGHSHGTHVAGTIGARGNNAEGVVGVNHEIKLAAVKMLSDGGSAFTSQIIPAIAYSTQMGFPVTNNSWGGGGYSQAMYDVISAANDEGILFVASAGNSARDTDQTPAYPASYDLPNIISVCSSDHNDNPSWFTNYGVSTVDLCAPGHSIYSTEPGNSYGYKSGTSMAAPHVAGAVGLVWGYRSNLDHLQLKNILMGSVDTPTGVNGLSASNGRLNLHSAFTQEVDTVAPAPVTDLTLFSVSTRSAKLTLTATGDDGMTGTATRYNARFSESPITPENFSSATPALVSPPDAPGVEDAITIEGLRTDTRYYAAVTVEDEAGNSSPISNVVTFTTAFAPVVFSDDMEGDVSDWKTPDTVLGDFNLWHVSSIRSNSPTKAWYYGREDTNMYDTGFENAGSIISPVIDLTNVTESYLEFSHFKATEDDPGWDRTYVYASTNDGATWTQIGQYFDTDGEWVNEVIDLADFDGQQIRIRFFFETRDAWLNEYEGWYVDDVIVRGNPGDVEIINVIDNGDDRFEQTGEKWFTKKKAGFDGDYSVASGGGNAKTARYTFPTVAEKTYRIATTWVPHNKAATNTPFDISTISLLDSSSIVHVNQQLEPSDFEEDGAMWHTLTYVTGEDDLTVEISNANANGKIIADAVRIDEVDSIPTPDPETVRIIDNWDAGYSQSAESGKWFNKKGAGYENDYSVTSGRAGRLAEWKFENLEPGFYRVSTTWVPGTKNTTNAPYTVFPDNAFAETVYMDQQKTPSESLDGSDWADIGYYEVTGSTLDVALRSGANGKVIADAVRIEKVDSIPTTPVASEEIIDNWDRGYNLMIQSGKWFSKKGKGHENDYDVSSGSAGRSASWTFSVTPGETVNLSLTWLENNKNSAATPITILDGATEIDALTVNQKLSPSGDTAEGSVFEALGTYVPTSDTITVKMSSGTKGKIVADAARLTR